MGASKVRGKTHSSRLEKAQHALTNNQVPISPLQFRLPALARRRCAACNRGAVWREVLRFPILTWGGCVRRSVPRAERMHVLILNDDAEGTHVEFEVRLDILEHDIPREAHYRAWRVELEQLVRAQAVPCDRIVVFEQLARREREHRVMVRREDDGELRRWGSGDAGGGGGDALRQWLTQSTQLANGFGEEVGVEVYDMIVW